MNSYSHNMAKNKKRKIKSAVPHEYVYGLSYGWMDERMGGNGAMMGCQCR